MIKSKFRGYSIKFEEDEWYFCESGDLVRETHKDIPCDYCGNKDTIDGHDGCLGTLPNIMNACCGHGEDDEAYIQYLNGNIVRGLLATAIIFELTKKKRSK